MGAGLGPLPAGRGGWSAPAAGAGTPSGRCHRSPRRPPGCSRSRGGRRGPARAGAAARGSRCRREAGERRHSPAPGAPAPAALGPRPASPLQAQSTAAVRARGRGRTGPHELSPPLISCPRSPRRQPSRVPAFPECFAAFHGGLGTGMRPGPPAWSCPSGPTSQRVPGCSRRPGSNPPHRPRFPRLFIAVFLLRNARRSRIFIEKVIQCYFYVTVGLAVPSSFA